MFRPMRRIKQLLSQEDTVQIFERGTSGTLAILGDDGYPYALPLSYVYSQGKIFFHSAKTGHKIDAIRANDKASFCVIDKDHIVPEEYTSYFRSAIAFGRIKIMEDEQEKRAALDILAQRYTPGREEQRQRTMDKELPALCMLELDIEHMTGKEAIDLVKGRT